MREQMLYVINGACFNYWNLKKWWWYIW